MENTRVDLRILGVLLYYSIAATIACCALSPYLLARYGFERAYIAPLCAIGAAFVFALWQLRGILRNVAYGDPFSRRTVAYLGRIAWMCLVVALASASMLFIFFSFIKVLMVLLAIAGWLVMRVLTWVFLLAAKQKEEMDLII